MKHLGFPHLPERTVTGVKSELSLSLEFEALTSRKPRSLKKTTVKMLSCRAYVFPSFLPSFFPLSLSPPFFFSFPLFFYTVCISFQWHRLITLRFWENRQRPWEAVEVDVWRDTEAEGKRQIALGVESDHFWSSPSDCLLDVYMYTTCGISRKFLFVKWIDEWFLNL